MILAVDIGNIHIVIGCIDENRTCFAERLRTDPMKTELEYAIDLKNILELYHITKDDLEGGIISSVVPPVSSTIRLAMEKVLGRSVLLVGPGVKTDLRVRMDNPSTVGTDLIVAAVAAIHDYPAPLIIVDMGTATTITCVDAEGSYVGGAIVPGVQVSLDSLVSRTAQLTKISLEAPERVIGKNTIDCMKSGAVYGNAAMIDGMIDRMEDELGQDATLIATGGLASCVVPCCRHSLILDDELILKGLWILYRKNVG